MMSFGARQRLVASGYLRSGIEIELISVVTLCILDFWGGIQWPQIMIHLVSRYV